MVRLIYGLLFVWFLIPPAAAQISDPYTSITQAELRVAILDGDIDKVERDLATAHARFLAGETKPNDLRFLYTLFGTTDPEILSFTREWLSAYPESPYAHAAQAWNDYNAAWLIRGEASANKTYPKALRMFSQLNNSAWSHARFALDARPRLLPASDALIRLGLFTRFKIKFYTVLDEVMEADPNWGSLYRAIDTTIPAWGGTWEVAENICEYYGPRLTELGDDPVQYCKLYAAGEIHSKFGDPLFHWVQQTLKNEDIPTLNHLRLRLATSAKGTRDDATFAYEYLTNLLESGGWNYSDAEDFDRAIARQYDFPLISEAHYRAMQENARAMLAKNPYDSKALQAIRIKRFTYEQIGENSSFGTVAEELAPEEEAEYVRRQLTISPYRPSYWSDYATLNYPMSRPDSVLYRDQYLTNAIVYSNHSPYYLITYAWSKYYQLKLYNQHQESISDQESGSVPAQIDAEAGLICPLVQSVRLFEELCEVTAVLANAIAYSNHSLYYPMGLSQIPSPDAS